MIKRIWVAFFKPSFLIFCIVGVLNTLIHLGVYNLILLIDAWNETFVILLGNTCAFIIASLFSYWANATFTYKKKMSQVSFILAMGVFLSRLLLSNLLLYLFVLVIKHFGWISLIPFAPLPVSMILIPLQFLVFNRIFSNSENITKNPMH